MIDEIKEMLALSKLKADHFVNEDYPERTQLIEHQVREMAQLQIRLIDALEKCVQQRDRFVNIFSIVEPDEIVDSFNQELTKILLGEAVLDNRNKTPATNTEVEKFLNDNSDLMEDLRKKVD